MNQTNFAGHKIPTELPFGEAVRFYVREFVIFGVVVAYCLILLLSLLTYGLSGLVIVVLFSALVLLYARQQKEILHTRQELDKVAMTYSRDMDLLTQMVQRNRSLVDEWQDKVTALEARVSGVDLWLEHEKSLARENLVSVLRSRVTTMTMVDRDKAAQVPSVRDIIVRYFDLSQSDVGSTTIRVMPKENWKWEGYSTLYLPSAKYEDWSKLSQMNVSACWPDLYLLDDYLVRNILNVYGDDSLKHLKSSAPSLWRFRKASNSYGKE